MRNAAEFVRRSQLVTPAINPKMMDKAVTLDCDTLIFDLEDAVAPSMKTNARSNLRSFLSKEISFGKEIGVRINGLESPWFLDDLLGLAELSIHTVVIPKIHCPDDVRVIHVLLHQLESRGLRAGVTLQLMIESGRGLHRAAEIARVSPRCVSLIFGAADFSAETGIAFTPRGLIHARAAMVLAAAAADVQVLDHVHPFVTDDDGLRAQSLEARELGFSGKWAIHPRQIPLINEVFTPGADEIAEARRVVEAYDLATANGSGAIMVDGSLVDEAVVKIMRRRIGIAQRLGL